MDTITVHQEWTDIEITSAGKQVVAPPPFELITRMDGRASAVSATKIAKDCCKFRPVGQSASAASTSGKRNVRRAE